MKTTMPLYYVSLLLIFLSACGDHQKSGNQAPEQPSKLQEVENEPAHFFNFIGQVLLEPRTRADDYDFVPNAFRVDVNESDRIRYDSGGMAYKSLQGFNPLLGPFESLIRRNRELII